MKTKIKTEDWVFLYSELSGYIEGRLCSFDNTTHDVWGNRLPETEDKFCDICADVEEIMSTVLEKAEL